MEKIQFDAKTVDTQSSAQSVSGITAGGQDTITAFKADWTIDRALKQIEIKKVYWSFEGKGNFYKLYISYNPPRESATYSNINYPYNMSEVPTTYIKDIPNYETIFAADSGSSKIQFLVKQSKDAPSGTSTMFIVSNVKLNIEYEILQRDSTFSIDSKTVTTNKNQQTYPLSTIKMTVVPGSNAYKHTVTIEDLNDPTGGRKAEFTFNNLSGAQSQLFKPTDAMWLPGMPNSTQMTARLTYKCYDGSDNEIDSLEQDIIIKCRDYNEEVWEDTHTAPINAYIHKETNKTFVYPPNSSQSFFLQNWSTLTVTASSSESSTNAALTGYCGSTITKVSIKCGGMQKTTSYNPNQHGNINLVVGTIAKTGTTDIVVTLTDSREKTRTLTNSQSVEPYSPPYISRFIAGRCAIDGKPDASNKYGFAVCDTVCQQKIGHGDVNNNYVTVTYYDSNPDVSGANVVPSYKTSYTTESGQTYYVDMFGTSGSPTQFASANSYTIYVKVEDDVGGYSINKAVIPTGAVFMSWRKGVNAIGFGGIPNMANTVYVANTMKLKLGSEVAAPPNYLAVRPSQDIDIAANRNNEIWLQTYVQRDDNKLFTCDGVNEGFIKCNADCFVEFSGNIYMATYASGMPSFDTSDNGRFALYIEIKKKVYSPSEQQVTSFVLAEIRPWSAEMNCTYSMPPYGWSVHAGDEIRLRLKAESQATGTIVQAYNGRRTYLTLKAIAYISAASSS